jgi:hypothetical protein
VQAADFGAGRAAVCGYIVLADSWSVCLISAALHNADFRNLYSVCILECPCQGGFSGLDVHREDKHTQTFLYGRQDV